MMILVLLGLTAVVAVISIIILIRVGRPVAPAPEVAEGVAAIRAALDSLPALLRVEGRESREDLRNALTAHGQQLETRLTSLETTITTRLAEFGKSQTEQLEAMRREAADGRQKLDEAVARNAEGFSEAQAMRLKETNDAVASLSDRLVAAHRDARDEQKTSLASVTDKVGKLIDANAEKQDALRQTISNSLDKLRVENTEKLELMRATVDEKLQGTLEKRLGESFQIVSDRLEQVHIGLGEMQSLATGVGDLKRVLSNVKSRGGWGEVQLGMLLEDMLTRDQFESNVKIRPDGGEIVEFAVKLPGRSGDEPLWLPIDAKFPHEDYERLLQAQETAIPEEVERAAIALEKAIKIQAKIICEKYIHPPFSTDFAIMYLPTEGLFAEVIRRPGLASELQTKHRIMVQGPTTLAALLTSLQMGFRTLAIEKRSSEVWQVLGAAKAEFEKYGSVWDKLGKQLDTARRTVEEAGKRTRAVTRRLRDVETLDPVEIPPLLDMALGETSIDDEEDDENGEEQVA
jgi:DNA recombination protein RmuC